MKPPKVRQSFGVENCSGSGKGLLSADYRRQALLLCLNPAAVVVIFNKSLLKVFYGVELLQI